MIVKRPTQGTGFGLFTDTAIKKGTILFRHDDWIEDEGDRWITLSRTELQALPPDRRQLFLRYCYDIDFDIIKGTFDWDCAQHIANFMNHSCNPNMIYDDHDTIVARRDIAPGEELTVDYGTFIANFDQEFECRCGSPECRKKITGQDWKILMDRYGSHFALFLRREIEKRGRGPA